MAHGTDHHRLHDGTHLTPKCILCGKCLEVCPLVAATGREELSPRAKFHLAARAAEVGSGLDEKKAARLAAMCLACGRCERACPHGLCGPELVSRLRAEHPGWREWLWRQWLTRPGALWPMAGALAKIMPGELAPERIKPLLRQLAALHGGRTIEPWLAVTRYDACGAGEKVLLFEGCTARHAKRHWSRAARAILTGLGYELMPGLFECCGCSMGHAGLEDAQRAVRRANVAVWRAAGRPLVAVFCATCRCGLRGYAQEDLGWEPSEREEWLRAVVPLAGLMGPTKFEVLDNAPQGVHYHRPCHGAGNDQDRQFLARAMAGRLKKAGLERCCGFGGVMQLADPGLSWAVAARCWEYFEARPGEQLLTGCSACVLQLSATAPAGVAVGHWLEIVRP